MVGAFCCLKQDGQDVQDGQDRAAQERAEKVWKTLMSIAPPRQKGVKVLKDLNLSSLQVCVFLLRSYRTLATHPTGFL